MAVPFSNTRLRVPQGFRNLLHVLAREVMRDQPPNMMEYAHDLMQKLLTIRRETGHDPVADGLHIEDRYYNNYSFQEIDIDLNDPAVNDAAVKIQAQFKGFQVRKQMKEKKEGDEGSNFEEAIDVELEDGGKDDSQVIDIDLNDPEVNAAATKIQAQYKGFKARKEIKETLDKEAV